jgi:hypothetical protein
VVLWSAEGQSNTQIARPVVCAGEMPPWASGGSVLSSTVWLDFMTNCVPVGPVASTMSKLLSCSSARSPASQWTARTGASGTLKTILFVCFEPSSSGYYHHYIRRDDYCWITSDHC